MAKGTKNAQSVSAASFPQVFREELAAVAARRDLLRRAGDKLPADGDQDRHLRAVAEAPAGVPLTQLQEEALPANLCGLAISGGGIRSATFAFGVLQGLAVAGLLPRFDYLSTVSGGGYIGSWLSAWIKRSGFSKVEKQLLPPRFREQINTQVEGEAVRHLRLYSNYLAPLPGVFSFDGWVLIAIYLRNLLLNQSVLLLAALALFIAIRAVIELFSLMHSLPPQSVAPQFVAVACGLVLLVAAVATGVAAPSRNPSGQGGRWTWPLWGLTVLSWAIAALFASLLLVTPESIEWLSGSGWSTTLLQTCLALAAFFLVLGPLGMSRRIAAAAWGVPAGALGGLVLYVGWLLLLAFAVPPSAVVAAGATFGVPLMLGSLVLAQFMHVGLVGPKLTELEREWWSGHNSRLLMLAAGWLGLFAIAIYGPWLVGQLVQIRWGKTLSALLGAGWVGTVIAGLRAAYGPDTGTRRRNPLKDGLAKIAPAVFLVGMFVILATLTNVVAYNTYAAFHKEPLWRFEHRLNDLLSDLEAAKSPIELLDGAMPLPAFWALVIVASLLLVASRLLGGRIGVNAFSLHNLYANRLVRCYLGASNSARQPHPMINLDPTDDIPLSSLAAGGGPQPSVEQADWGPLPIINGALNRKAGDARANRTDKSTANGEGLAESLAFIERQAESWTFTPFYCGSETTGYCPTPQFAGDVKLGTAIAVSGAAVSPNMGYHSSPAITVLLTVFNVRLGAWFGNPRIDETRGQDNPAASWNLLVNELTGRTKATSQYVYVSDGGHFDNLGVYELIRRRCRFIVVIDAGADPQIHENVGHLVRKVRIDFGVRIDVSMMPVTPASSGKAAAHLVIGRIHYGDVHPPAVEQEPADPDYLYENNQGIIIWLKNSLVGDEPGDLANFNAMHPEFPFDTTLDQFFSESQFESYRVLGVVTVRKMLENVHFPASAKDRQERDEWLKERTPRAQQAAQAPDRPLAEPYQAVECLFTSRTDDRPPAIEAQPAARRGPPAESNLYKYPTEPLFRTLFDYWLAKPSQFVSDYVEQNQSYIAVLDKLRGNPNLQWLAQELYGSDAEKAAARAHSSTGTDLLAERLMVAEMLTLLENAWVALDLERHRLHPVHAGWMRVFKNWLSARHFSDHWDDRSDGAPTWTGLKHEFSPVFRRFIERVRKEI